MSYKRRQRRRHARKAMAKAIYDTRKFPRVDRKTQAETGKVAHLNG